MGDDNNHAALKSFGANFAIGMAAGHIADQAATADGRTRGFWERVLPLIMGVCLVALVLSWGYSLLATDDTPEYGYDECMVMLDKETFCGTIWNS
ncbi:hypothetical protein FOJ82_11160 [Tessaracoccus rhinocerotis]|uniref:Uncharacterized protein n=1 Tax=Tessaracoccus rhinocerotis TaxID=1689449 RepID=A0A553JZE7_9ACTN|nr:hypothetical protein [Tessaracoccus rhinocerotis]TRY17819.1 hypothetical protein FOJ82_11160 [Tessaracoccus rhinocerotis]